MPVWA